MSIWIWELWLQTKVVGKKREETKKKKNKQTNNRDHFAYPNEIVVEEA
jgi:hypothetical protein